MENVISFVQQTDFLPIQLACSKLIEEMHTLRASTNYMNLQLNWNPSISIGWTLFFLFVFVRFIFLFMNARKDNYNLKHIVDVCSRS